MINSHVLYQLSYQGIETGAEYQNRTDDERLETFSFTIKLIPHVV